MNWLKEHEIDSWILKGAFVLMLLFPAFYSPRTDIYELSYYEGFSWAYFLLALYLLLQLLWNRKKLLHVTLAGIGYIVLLLLYNGFSLYYNHTYLQWYWEQINNTIAFLFLGILIGFQVKLDGRKHDNVRFLIHCIVLSNAASILYYLMGYSNFLICNNQFIFDKLPEGYYEARHYWIYSHKSEYALMLTTFLAFFLAYRKKFRNRVTFCASLAVLLVCLVLTHSWTGIAGGVLVLGGALLDLIDWRKFRLRLWHLGAVCALAIVGCGVAYGVLKERDLSTLGSRIPIWKTALETIKEYPQGWGTRFGPSKMWVTEYFGVNNAHNVFLNQILRFSIPVGICFILLFLAIVIYTLVKGRSFLMLCTWLALLVIMSMDYSLMSLQMALLFLLVYLIMIKKRDERIKRKAERDAI